MEPEQCSLALLQAQVEDWQVLLSLVQPAGTLAAATVAATGLTHVTLLKMDPQDYPKAFIKLFQHALEVCSWPTL